MTYFIRILVTLSMLFGVSVPALAADTLEATWLRLIRTEFESSCAVERVKIGSVVSGNNGLRTEQWFLQTCRGAVAYRVVYYPASAFPNRTSPYEVTRVAPVTGARAKN